MKIVAAFTLLEVVLSLVVMGLISAVLGSVLVNSIKSQSQAYEIIRPSAETSACFNVLREDLISAPRPNGTSAAACVLETEHIGGSDAAKLTITSSGASAMHPSIIDRAVKPGQEMIVWSLFKAEGDPGLLWLRSSSPRLLATGSVTEPLGEIMLEDIDYLTMEVYVSGNWVTNFNSDESNGVLPQALRLRYARFNKYGLSGPEKVIMFNFSQVLLDPIQMAGG